MKFYCITYDLDHPCSKLLQSSCMKSGIEFVQIDPLKFSYGDDLLSGEKKLLYRVSKSGSNQHVSSIEKFLINDETATFYSSSPAVLSKPNQLMIFRENHIPIPKTVYSVSNNVDLLKKEVKYLGGFPLILKALGGSHGVGVMKIDSFESLISFVDFLYHRGHSLILREFIDVKKSARLIVLGRKVIDSVEYVALKDDFRTNRGQSPIVQPKIFSKDVQKIALKAVKVLGKEFGGVDILIDKNNRSYVTEVNFPCNFSRCQLLTGKDISGMMIDHLLKKSKKL